jgi:diguanylate cyclase (GGDEF)-like protein
VYSSILSILTHLSFSEPEARRHWRRIQAHRERIRRRLARDVGMRVALLDYFVNLNRELKNPKVIEIAIYERTERSAVTDGLTGLYNHAYFTQALKREVERCKRHDLKMSLVFLDLDDFKKLNDTRGHLEGDRVLVKAAAQVRGALREIDVAARYGGEEFAVILPETAREGARVVAERIRARIEQQFGKRKAGPRVTVSGGVATLPDDAAAPDDLIRRADECLYRSKAAGKNRITVTQRDRRQHERTPVDHPVSVRPDAGPRLSARARDVSVGGLLIVLRQPVPQGSAVSLVIRPPGAAPLAVRGEVVRVTPRGAGRERSFAVGVRLLEQPTRPFLALGKPGAAARG